MKRTRVLLVEDSPTVRARLRATIEAEPSLELIAEAEDGKRAIELCQAQRPDVIALDMMMPVMTGLAATEFIMAYCPTPILIVSASTNRGELFHTYHALSAGAVDVLEKPRGDEPEGVWERKFVAALKLVARIKVITHPRATLGLPGGFTEAVRSVPTGVASSGRTPSLIVIGASTGGPSALVEILRALPAPLPVPVLIVLHIDQPFGSAFAEWLNGVVEHPVAFARDGESLSSLRGRVTMAPPDRHLIIRGGKLALTDDAKHLSCRPSVDVLFESVAREHGPDTVACLLTGMGRDGAQGMLQLRLAGAMTCAQDEQSCVVYGMPREAVLNGGAERSMALSGIGPWLTGLVNAAAPSTPPGGKR